MKIAEVNTYFVRPRWGFLEITTDQGISGWGEAVLEGHTATVLSCVQEMKDYLLGKDPSGIEGLWEEMYRAGFYRGGGVLMSAINKELVIEENKTPHNWKNPVWHHADGSVAEW